MYIKHSFFKNDIAATTTAKSEVCIGCFPEYCYLVVGNEPLVGRE